MSTETEVHKHDKKAEEKMQILHDCTALFNISKICRDERGDYNKLKLS
jgi:hypothetical protein